MSFTTRRVEVQVVANWLEKINAVVALNLDMGSSHVIWELWFPRHQILVPGRASS